MQWRVIEYREFYDVPRMIVATNDEGAFLFYSRFDEHLDSYLTHYEVFRLPNTLINDLPRSWVDLEQRAIGRIADVPVNELPFAVERRIS
ncbi:MAG: hypothetical protein ABI583_10830 [Betaproteobacteria bacterium]